MVNILQEIETTPRKVSIELDAKGETEPVTPATGFGDSPKGPEAGGPEPFAHHANGSGPPAFYLTVYAAHALKTGTLKPGATSMSAGRLGTIAIQGDNILLGKPMVFTKDNIDQFDF